jgi:hypothetical protein
MAIFSWSDILKLPLASSLAGSDSLVAMKGARPVRIQASALPSGSGGGSGTVTASQITDAGAAGRLILQDATHAAQAARLPASSLNGFPAAVASVFAEAQKTIDRLDVSATTYTVLLANMGRQHNFTANAAVSLTLPKNAPDNSVVPWTVSGTGTVSFLTESGAPTLQHVQQHTKSGGQFADGVAYVVGNSGGNAAQWRLSGATAA